MFADYIKMGVKIGLIALVTAAILVLFTSVTIPSLDMTFLNSCVSSVLALIYHWCPGATVVVPVALGLFSVQLAIMLFEYASIAFRWLFKVNE